MTLIALDGKALASKAALKAALDEGSLMLHEPSIMGSWTKAARDLPVGFEDNVTRMPQRDKFPVIRRTAKGWEVK